MMDEVTISLDAGRARLAPRGVIVHAMGEFLELGQEDASAWQFLGKLGLSAHAFVTPSGVVVRGRRDDQGAYHAKGANDCLGVEFLVPGVHTYSTFLEAIKTEYLTAPQYAAGVELVRGWVIAHALEPGQVRRHSDQAPGRKHDPGPGFPWPRFIEDVFRC